MATGSLGAGRYGTVEVIRDIVRKHAGPTEPSVTDLSETDPVYMVLYSESDGPEGDLECRVGFSNDPARCDLMTGWGFPFVEASIQLSTDGELQVRSAAFTQPAEGKAPDRELDYDCLVLSITGVKLGLPSDSSRRIRGYQQSPQTPDLAAPASRIRASVATWRFRRRGRDLLNDLATPVTMTLEPLRWPQAVALKVPATSVWAGLIVMPPAWPSTITTRRQQRLDRPVQYGTPESIFRHVEVLGFRLDIPSEDTLSRATGSEARQAGKLFELISPLNFHLDPRGYNDSARPDFYYRPATSGLTIELLRYGRMSMAKASGDLTAEDFQSQHELLVRLVVGRVDEDSAQAQEVATFVPVLFVDNTWSKFLGRKFMGLDKRLAFFCARDGEDRVPLSPRDAAEWEEGGGRPKPRSLAEIAQVCLAQRVLPELRDGMAAGDASALEEARRRILTAAPAALEIACDPDLIDDWDRFELAPTDAVLRRSPIAPRRWRQDDFEDGEVRRDFARAAAAGSTGSFLGIQSAPIGEKGLRAAWKKEATWITGRYKMAGSAMLARPRGVITIKLRRLEGNPVEGWDRLCDLLNVPKETSDGGPGFLSVTLGPGSWYRLLYDMDLSLENGLE